MEDELMTYKGYSGSVRFNKAENLYHGRVLGIKSTVAYDGKTLEELKTHFERTVDFYLELCAYHNTPPEVPPQ